MKSSLHHIQLNIDYKNISFYKDLVELLGFTELYSDDSISGYKGTNGVDVWFSQAPEGGQHNHSQIGLSHVGFNADSIEEVDAAAEFLNSHDIKPLYDTPKHRSEFAMSEDETYYQVMFETPDGLLIEIMYSGKK